MPLKPGQRQVVPTQEAGDISGILAKSPKLQEIYTTLEQTIEKTKQELSKADGWNQSWLKSRLQRDEKNLDSFKTGVQNIGSILPKLKADCSEALASFSKAGKMLYRGIQVDDDDAALVFLGMPRDDRKASDTSQAVHELLTKMFTKAGIKANRANSIFCSANKSQAASYGDIYIIVPKNGFDFSWSPKYRDFYNDFIEDVGNSIEEFNRKFQKGGVGDTKIQFGNELSSDASRILGIIRDRADDVRYEDREPQELRDIAYKVAGITYSMQRWLYGTFIKTQDLKTFEKSKAEFFEMVNALNTSPDIRRKFIQDGEMELLGDAFRHVLDQIDAYNAQQQASMNKLPQGNDAKIVDFIRVQNQFTDKDFVAALQSNNEICIRGEYYAFRATAFEEIFKGVFNIKEDDE